MEKLLKQYRETGSIAPKVRIQQTPTKLNQEQLNVLSSIVADKNDATLDELRMLLKQQTGVLISRSTIDRMLRLLNLNLKKKHYTQPKKRLKEFNSRREEFWQTVQGILAKDLIFIDESGVNLSLVRLFARAPKGKRARGERPSKRGKNVSLIGAIGLKGVITPLSLVGATDGLTFEAFISQKLVPKLWKGAILL